MGVLVVSQTTTGEVVLGGRVRTQSALTSVGVNTEFVGGSQDGVGLGHQGLEHGPLAAQPVVVGSSLVTAVALDTGFDITTEAGLAEARVHFSIITAEAGLAEAGVSLDITTEAGLAEASLDLSIITAEAGLAEGNGGSDIITAETGLAETGLHFGIITAEAGLAEAGVGLGIITAEAGLAETGLHFGIITAEAGLAEAGVGLGIITTEAGFAELGLDFNIAAEAGLAEASSGLDIITTETGLAESRLCGRFNRIIGEGLIPLVLIWSSNEIFWAITQHVGFEGGRTFPSRAVHREVTAEPILVCIGEIAF